MKWLLIIPAVFTFFTSAAIAQQTKSKPNLKPACNPYVEERLSYYFSRNAIEATQIVNNTDDIPNRSRTEVIKVGSHTVEWIVDAESRKAVVSVRVNGDLITLDDKQSLNSIDGDQRLDLNVIGEWYQVKLYKLGDGEIIALTMGPEMCTGLMCSVAAQLYYDTTAKRSELFGRYRTDHEAAALPVREA